MSLATLLYKGIPPPASSDYHPFPFQKVHPFRILPCTESPFTPSPLRPCQASTLSRSAPSPPRTTLRSASRLAQSPVVVPPFPVPLSLTRTGVGLTPLPVPPTVSITLATACPTMQSKLIDSPSWAGYDGAAWDASLVRPIFKHLRN